MFGNVKIRLETLMRKAFDGSRKIALLEKIHRQERSRQAAQSRNARSRKRRPEGEIERKERPHDRSVAVSDAA
jgi:hypothetical protein